MGYGFGRSMWKYIRQLSDKFLKNRHNDWAMAVAECLWQFPKNLSVKQCELSGFLKTSQIETYQPSLSRVWHIGRNSTVGSSHSTHVQARPPWSDQRLLGKENITENITVAIGRHDWFGFPCNYMGRDPAICVGQFSGHFPFSKRHSVNFNPILKHGGPWTYNINMSVRNLRILVLGSQIAHVLYVPRAAAFLIILRDELWKIAWSMVAWIVGGDG